MQLLTRDQIAPEIKKIKESAARAKDSLTKLISSENPLSLLQAIKFQKIGFDPLNVNINWNLIEQVNQTFTYLVSYNAADLLFTLHPEAVEIQLNLGTEAGYDIVGIDIEKEEVFAAEVFAATNIHSNEKLRRDLMKVLTSNAKSRYVFFSAGDVSDVGWYTKYRPRFDISNVKVYSFGNDSTMSKLPSDSYDMETLDHLKCRLLELAKIHYPNVDLSKLIDVTQEKATYRSNSKDDSGNTKFLCEITVAKNDLTGDFVGFSLTYMSKTCFQIHAPVSTSGGVLKLLDSYEHDDLSSPPRPCNRKPIYEVIVSSD
jgi:hypothetical protein